MRAKAKRAWNRFDQWVEGQIGRLEPEQRHVFAIVMLMLTVLGVIAAGVVYLVMIASGVPSGQVTDSDPFTTPLGLAVVFGYLTIKAALYEEPPLTPEQQLQRRLRQIWRQERSLREITPWPQFMAWAQAEAGQVEVWIIRRDPDGTFDRETFVTLPGDSSAEQGAELMWRAREHVAQAEADAIAEQELARSRERHALAAQEEDERRRHEDEQIAQRAARDAAALSAAQVHDQRIESEGLAAAMREAARRTRI